MKAHPLSIRQKAIALHGQGKKLTDISSELAVSYDSVCDWVKRSLSEGTSCVTVRYSNCGRRSQVDPEVKQLALNLKGKHEEWGAPFIRLQLLVAFPGAFIPQPRHIQRWFVQAGLKPLRTRLPKTPADWAASPLACVQVDANEKLKTADGKDCCYLTFTDEYTGSALGAFVFPPQEDCPGSGRSGFRYRCVYALSMGFY